MKVQNRRSTTLRARLQAGTVLALVLGMLALPVSVSAQSPTADQYSVTPPSSNTGSGGDPGDPGDPGTGLSDPVGPLPFTGFDVIAMAAVALAIAGLGLGLQRAFASRPQA